MDTSSGAVAHSFRLADKTGGRSEIWNYFGFVADSAGKPIDTERPVCKRCLKAVHTKGGNTSNLAKHLKVRHADLYVDFKRRQSKQKNTTTQDVDCNIEPEPLFVSGKVQFRAKILALMESLMVKTTSEIVSIFDDIYMDAEKELIRKRKEVETLTQSLEESERLCAQNLCHNQPDLKVERGQELLDSVQSYGQPAQEKTETVELSLECVMLKTEDHVNLEPAVQPYEYQVVLSNVTNDQQLLLGSSGGPAGEAEDQVSPMEQPHQTDLETTAPAAVAEQSFSVSTGYSTSAGQDLESTATPESNRADLPPRRCRGRPAECLESSLANTSSDACSLVQSEDLNRTNEELLSSPVGATGEAEDQVSPMEQPYQTDLETTAPAAVAEQSFSVPTEDSASAGHDSVVSGVPESDQAASPPVRHRGWSAGRSSLPPRRTLPLRSCTATSSTKSRPQRTSKKLDSSPNGDACRTNPSQYLNKEDPSVTEDASTDTSSEPDIKMPSIDLKSKSVRRTEKSKASENSEDHQGENEILIRGFEVKSEVIPWKKRRMMEPECKHDVNGTLHPVTKILQTRTTAGGQEEVRVKWSPCSSCGAKWRNSWEPA